MPAPLASDHAAQRSALAQCYAILRQAAQRATAEGKGAGDAPVHAPTPTTS